VGLTWSLLSIGNLVLLVYGKACNSSPDIKKKNICYNEIGLRAIECLIVNMTMRSSTRVGFSNCQQHKIITHLLTNEQGICKLTSYMWALCGHLALNLTCVSDQWHVA
jgi:hypothetical protein